MKKEFVTYEQAVALKKLGFDSLCFAFWSNIVDNKTTEIYTIRMGLESSTKEIKGINYTGFLSAPLKQQVFRWFREKYDAHMHPDKLMPGVYIIRYGDWTSITYNTYEEAESACIDKLIELAKQDNDKN